jgi:biotin-(acetyl-CoA carboxylase) ligase
MNVNDYSALDTWSKNPNDVYLAVDKKGNLTTETKWLDKLKHFFGFGKSSTMDKVESAIAFKFAQAGNNPVIDSDKKETYQKLLERIQHYHEKERHPKTLDTNKVIVNLEAGIAICEATEKLEKSPQDKTAQKALVLALYKGGEINMSNDLAKVYGIDKDPALQRQKAGNIQAVVNLGFGQFKAY